MVALKKMFSLVINSQTALVWWLRLYAPNAVAWVQSLVGRLRSDMPHGMAKKN